MGEVTPLMWHSNAPWVGTGYGSQTAVTAPLVAEKLGLDLAFSAFFGLGGSRIGWQAKSGQVYSVYPRGKAPYGNDVIGAHTSHFFDGRRGLVVTLTDPWVLNPAVVARLPVLAWTPVDHDPLIPATLDWFKKSQAIPLAMSPFGERVMREAGLDPLLAEHGIDTQLFAPHPEGRAAAAKEMGIDPDVFLVSIVAANQGTPSRKNFGAAIAAYAKLAQHAGQGRTLLYIHSNIENDDGEDIPGICKLTGVTPLVPDQYKLELGMPASQVATAMQASNVLLNPAWGEGFGLTQVEANACGCPVIGTRFAAAADVVPENAGNWLVGEFPRDRIWTQFGSWQCKVSEGEIADALVEAYEEDAELAARRRELARENAERYDAEYMVNETWRWVVPEALRRLKYREQKLQVIEA